MTDSKSIDQEKVNQVPAANYSPAELIDIGLKVAKLYKAKINRDTLHPEFNNTSYLTWFSNNEIIANTMITRDKTNKDLAVHAGTVEQKLMTILSEVNRLNLMGEVRVFDKESNELQELGMSLTDITDKTAEMEGDDEKKLIRQLELIKQGTVFVQDNWVKKWQKSKTLNKTFNGQVKGIEWETKLEKVWDGPVRSTLYGPGVYLGNIREFEMKNQPFIFTMKLTSYQEAKSRYGAQDEDHKDVWERWENVPRRRVSIVDETNLPNMLVGQGWSLSDLEDEMVEEIHYQDQINNEYQIFLNGIAMLPVGFPLSAITPKGMFNVEKQVLQVINPFFAYGRSFIAKTQQLSELLDEMIKLLIIKTRKSIHPPYANISGKVISEKSLMPGAISMGIDPGALVAIGNEGQGATASEYQMLKELREDIDRVTVSPQISGQAGKSGTTAFEVSLLQQQAQKTISLIIFAAALLEKKVTWLRVNYVIGNYFEPIGTKVDDVRNELINIYRTMSKNTTVSGRGNGIRKIIPHDGNKMTPKDVYQQEEYTGTTKTSPYFRKNTRTELGMAPLQVLYIDVNILKNCKYIFFIEVESKPKDTSTNAKLMFREELRDLQGMQVMGATVNIEEVQNEYARIWHKRKETLFGKPQPMQPQAQGAAGAGASSLNDNTPNLVNKELEGPLA